MRRDKDFRALEKEFDDFSYIVSHDLGAPLRHLREFTHLLLEGRSDSGNEEERQYGHYIGQSLIRLDEMMEALIAYSRVTTGGGPFKTVRTDMILDDALESLSGKINIAAPIINRRPLPSVSCDPAQIELLFQIFLDNALKFARKSEKTEIRIKAHRRKKDILFEILDNGIGIAPEYHEEIFRMFRRLHVYGTYEGAGAGLAIARKIIRRHGGTIRIKSKPGEGTAVLFSLPRAEA